MQDAWLTRGGTRPVLEPDCGDGEVWCAEQAVQSPAMGADWSLRSTCKPRLLTRSARKNLPTELQEKLVL